MGQGRKIGGVEPDAIRVRDLLRPLLLLSLLLLLLPLRLQGL